MSTQLERSLQTELLWRLARYPVSEQAAQFAHELHRVFGAFTAIAGRTKQLQVGYDVRPAPAQRDDVINFVRFAQCLPAYRTPFVLRIVKSGYFGHRNLIGRSENPPVVRPQAHCLADFRALAVFNSILFLLRAALWRCCLLLASLSYIRLRSPSFVIRAPFLTPLRLHPKQSAMLGNVRPGFVLFPILCHILFSVFCFTFLRGVSPSRFLPLLCLAIRLGACQPRRWIGRVFDPAALFHHQPITVGAFCEVRIWSARPMYPKVRHRFSFITAGTLLRLRDWIVVRHSLRITECAA